MKIKLYDEDFLVETKLKDWAEFIKIVCQELLKRDLGVSKVEVDGVKIPMFTLDELSKFKFDEVNEVSIEGANIYDTIRSILDEIKIIIPETEEYHSQVALMINSGKEKEGLLVLDPVLRYWQNLIQVIKVIGDVAANKGKKLPNLDQITLEFQQLEDISSQIKASIKTGDFINVADTVEHVLKPRIWVWKQIVDELCDFMPSSN
ncbi:MAG: hypothetical protein HY606_09350 [Planctomycetes bacterium]|nr:hypothetical protein [Planctomycetota bacterium]